MPFFTRGLKPERVEPPPSMFKYRLEGDSISGSSYYDPYSVTMDNMSVFSAASSVVNPQSVRGIVHRLWNDFDNRFMRGMFGGKPHDNTNIFDANPFNSVNTNSAGGESGGGGGGSVGGPAAGQAAGGLATAPSGPGGVVPGTIQGALPQFHFNSALNPAEHGALPNSPVRRTQQQGQHLYALTENTAINARAAAGGGGGVDRTDHGTFGGGGGREETKGGDVAAVPPMGSSSGGQPI
ncbi:unnamed protein product [Ectocarpus sp. 12 AP-2014]